VGRKLEGVRGIILIFFSPEIKKDKAIKQAAGFVLCGGCPSSGSLPPLSTPAPYNSLLLLRYFVLLPLLAPHCLR
jgi:hypothetical protein